MLSPIQSRKWKYRLRSRNKTIGKLSKLHVEMGMSFAGPATITSIRGDMEAVGNWDMGNCTIRTNLG